MRSLVLAVALLLLASPVLAFTTEVAGAGSSCTSIRVGQSCYKDFTTSAAASLNIQSCESAKVSVISNIASSSDHDASVVSYACPAGTTTASATLCRAVPYRDSTGTIRTALTGEAIVGRDALYGIVAQNLVVDVTTSSQTTRVQVDCR